MKSKRMLRLNVIDKQDAINNKVRNFLKSQGIIVYGARSINAQSNILTRDTSDWDAFAKQPKKTANQLQKELDRIVKGDYFYSKPAQHKGTYKVKGIGNDLIRDNEDDESIADFSKPDKKIRYKIINGLKYRNLKDEIKAKQKSISNPEFKFRYTKDKGDLDRIKANIKIQRLLK
jgi:hypothetical protein